MLLLLIFHLPYLRNFVTLGKTSTYAGITLNKTKVEQREKIKSYLSQVFNNYKINVVTIMIDNLITGGDGVLSSGND